MIKAVVVSDSHGFNAILDRLVEEHADADYFLHLGDLEDDPALYPRYEIVKGNMDRNIEAREKIVELGGYRIYMCHSNDCNYFNRLYQLKDRAEANDCTIALYGHTHIPRAEVIEGVLTFNPGSVSEGRSELGETYGILYLDETEVRYEYVIL